MLARLVGIVGRVGRVREGRKRNRAIGLIAHRLQDRVAFLQLEGEGVGGKRAVFERLGTAQCERTGRLVAVGESERGIGPVDRHVEGAVVLRVDHGHGHELGAVGRRVTGLRRRFGHLVVVGARLGIGDRVESEIAVRIGSRRKLRAAFNGGRRIVGGRHLREREAEPGKVGVVFARDLLVALDRGVAGRLIRIREVEPVERGASVFGGDRKGAVAVVGHVDLHGVGRVVVRDAVFGSAGLVFGDRVGVLAQGGRIIGGDLIADWREGDRARAVARAGRHRGIAFLHRVGEGRVNAVAALEGLGAAQRERTLRLVAVGEGCALLSACVLRRRLELAVDHGNDNLHLLRLHRIGDAVLGGMVAIDAFGQVFLDGIGVGAFLGESNVAEGGRRRAFGRRGLHASARGQRGFDACVVAHRRKREAEGLARLPGVKVLDHLQRSLSRLRISNGKGIGLRAIVGDGRHAILHRHRSGVRGRVVGEVGHLGGVFGHHLFNSVGIDGVF